MKLKGTDDRKALNKEHTIRPQPGDLWIERVAATYLVVWTDGWYVEYLDHAVHRKTMDDGWTWDTDKPLIRKTVEEFSKMLHYSNTPELGCWCDVSPGQHEWAVQEALANRKKHGGP